MIVASSTTGVITGRRRSKRRDRLVAIGILVLVVLVPVLVIFVGPITLKAYDASHRTEVTCEVRSAHTGVGTSRSVNGVGSSSNQVVIVTSDCGTLTLRWGVTSENKESIADGFAAGTTWKFEVGAGSYKLHPFLDTIRQAVFVREPRRA
ncbi:hypothetical protein [Curtobacterium herbarum]|uniref:DUF4307 domain-containing protein n=1 Tax=Curtobacterium herbarum TaxID=150122 RepID=A0ABN1ZDV8_9MICO|nr:hypothetical protein [Curtobacterium herbarum]MBM7474198.1 hypothetical protein [Curtobacterium herbarum]MCS6546021.1 hypothetical protein [Curtobacterium herbarum]